MGPQARLWNRDKGLGIEIHWKGVSDLLSGSLASAAGLTCLWTGSGRWSVLHTQILSCSCPLSRVWRQKQLCLAEEGAGSVCFKAEQERRNRKKSRKHSAVYTVSCSLEAVLDLKRCDLMKWAEPHLLWSVSLWGGHSSTHNSHFQLLKFTTEMEIMLEAEVCFASSGQFVDMAMPPGKFLEVGGNSG